MNNNFNKVKQFFKKEGFYVILFVCLCAVATVAAVTAGRNNSKNTDNDNDVAIVDQTNNGSAVNQPENPDNALQVQEELDYVPVVQNNNEETAPVSNSADMSFENPVVGTLARAYSEDPVYWATTDSYKTHLAMDIKAEEGTVVTSVGAGVIKNVGVNTEGTYVEVDHQNGLTTIYGNLQEQVSVKVGDAITAGQQIGTVGNTTNLAYEEYGKYLHFQVLKDGAAVDPAKYVSYEK